MTTPKKPAGGHTPLPWTYRPEIGGVYSHAGEPHADGKPRTCVADTGEAGQTWNGRPLPEAEREANARFIVTACNSHTRLAERVRVLEAALTKISDFSERTAHCTLKDLGDVAKSALAKGRA